jgi:uncharacterized protein YjbI with pentapeptide repeats/beta-lactamase regulating signal transducer with metallopeptidase domain
MNLPVIVATALVASIAAGGLLTAGIALLVRWRSFDASARHALWFATLIALALLPLAGVAMSVVHAVRVPVAGGHWVSPAAASRAGGSTLQSASGVAISSSSKRNAQAASARVSHAAVAPAQSHGSALAAPWSTNLAVAALGAIAIVALAGLISLAVRVVQIGAVKRRSSPLDHRLADDLPWLTETHRGRETYLRLSYEIEAPVAIGFNRPVILIPTELATHNGLVGIEDLVIHEHAHLCRYDDYTNLVQRTIERLFWFNPFVWILGRRIALEREIAADDAVVARTSDRARYADALWRLAREMRMPAYTLVAPGALFTRKQISIRIEALLAPSRAQLRRLGPASVAAALGIGLVSCAIVAFAAPPLELPAPPALAAPPWPLAAAKAPAHPPLVAKLEAPTPVTAPRPPAQKLAIAADAVALGNLTGLISARLAELKSGLGAKRSPSADVRAEQQHELALLHHKLAVMQEMAQQDDLRQMQEQVVALQDTARSLDDEIAAQPPPALPPPLPPVHARAVAPPVSAKAPPVNVNVPPVNINVPPVDVNVPGVDVHVPALSVHVPGTSVHVPRTQSQIAAALDAGSSQDTTLTRALIAHCIGCDLSHRDLRNLDLHGLTLSGLDMHGADLRGVNLSGSQLSGVDLTSANLDGANLTNTRFSGDDIVGASFRGAKMDGTHFEGISLRHGAFDNAGVREILLRGCSGCDLSHMDLRGIDLHGVTLIGADLSHTDLSGANLSGTHFSGVSFDNANLSHADLRNASLTGCSMHHTSLDGAQLEGISLSGTSLGS